MSVFNIGADGDGHGLKWIYTTTHCVTPYGMTHTDQKHGQLEHAGLQHRFDNDHTYISPRTRKQACCLRDLFHFSATSWSQVCAVQTVRLAVAQANF